MQKDGQFIYSVIDEIDTGVIVLDKEFNILLWNQFMVHHSQKQQKDVLYKNLFECFPELPISWLTRKLKAVVHLEHEAFTSWEQRPYLFKFSHTRLITGGTDHMYQDCRMFPILNEKKRIEFIGISIKDVTDTSMYALQLQETAEELERISAIDGLTGAFNRTHWETSFEKEFQRVQRHGGSLSVIMLDMDLFKDINDTYGHLCGDEVLKSIVRCCNELVRGSDVIGRYGGEEFCIFLPETDAQGAFTIAERIRRKIAAEPIIYKDKPMKVSSSLGIASLDSSLDTNHEQLLNRADTALYSAKNSGRNRTVIFKDE